MNSAPNLVLPPRTKLPRSERHARVSAKLSALTFIARKSPFQQEFLNRNLRRWRRVINHLPPFRPDNLDHPARYARRQS